MHNRALHDSLAAFVEEAAWQLAEEVSGGAEIPFELDATPTRSRAAVLLPPADRALHRASASAMLAAAAELPAGRAGPRARCPTCRPTCATRGRRVPAGDREPRRRARCRRSSARSGPTSPTSSSTPSASRAAYAELEEVAYAGCALSRRAHARRRPRDRVRRGGARRRARARARDDARRRARRPAPTTRTRRSPCSRSRPSGRRPRARGRRPPPAPPADRAAPVGRRRARARPDGLGAHRRRALDGRPARHRPAPPARATACSAPRRRTRCARSAASSSRRTPRAGELAWALRRFELGCERGSARRGADRLAARRPRAVRRRRPPRLRRRRRAARRDLRRGARPRPRSRPACARRSRSSAPRWSGFVRAGDEVDALVVRARRLPARGAARRALRPPRPGAAARRRRARAEADVADAVEQV